MLVAKTAHIVHVCIKLSRISAPAVLERECSMTRSREADRHSILRCDPPSMAVGACERRPLCAALLSKRTQDSSHHDGHWTCRKRCYLTFELRTSRMS